MLKFWNVEDPQAWWYLYKAHARHTLGSKYVATVFAKHCTKERNKSAYSMITLYLLLTISK